MLSADKLPVWVYIYGGRRVSGGASVDKLGPHYIMDKPVIFITMTYRVNLLGRYSYFDEILKIFKPNKNLSIRRISQYRRRRYIRKLRLER